MRKGTSFKSSKESKMKEKITTIQPDAKHVENTTGSQAVKNRKMLYFLKKS